MFGGPGRSDGPGGSCGPDGSCGPRSVLSFNDKSEDLDLSREKQQQQYVENSSADMSGAHCRKLYLDKGGFSCCH